MHLPGVRVVELADLEVDYHEASEPPVEEKQVDAEPGVIKAQSTLAPDERKVIPQLQQKIGQVPDKRVLKIRLRILVFQTEKFEHERIPNSLLGFDDVGRLWSNGIFQHRRFVLRQRRALVELAADLPVQLAH